LLLAIILSLVTFIVIGPTIVSRKQFMNGELSVSDGNIDPAQVSLG